MPGHLTRYIARELLKTILVTTGVLVTVIAFGATIKPLVRNLLGGFDVLRYVAMASVPMLQYALPFSAGFGATLVMHRMAADNEVVAMSASGLSYRRIFRPIFLLAAVLLVVMLVLVNFIVPVFWSRMEGMLTRDVTRMLASAVEQGEAFQLGETLIYADGVEIDDAPAGTEAVSRLILVGVAAVQSGELGVETEFTADYATLDLYRIEGRSILKLALGDASVFRSADETLVRMPAAEPRAIDLGRRLEPSPKMFTLPRMLAVRAAPLDFWRVDNQVDRLREDRRLHQLKAFVTERFEAGDPVVLEDQQRGGAYTITPSKAGAGTLDDATVRYESNDGAPIEVVADRVEWTAVLRGVDDLVDIEFDLPPESVGAGLPRVVRSLRPRSLAPVDRSGEATVAWARAVTTGELEATGSASRVDTHLKAVDRSILQLSWEIDARIRQRFAQALTGPLLLVLGSILAIRLRHATPLAVYLVAFLPAIADILLISAGEQMLRRGAGVEGHLLLWSGNVLLVLICLVNWWRLRRH